MKNYILNPVKIGMLITSFILACGFAKGVTYTAVASGNWSSTTTWSGGIAPPFNITSADQINIGATYTVTMDSTVVIDNVLAGIDVSGTLTAGTNYSLNIMAGTLSGSGSITADQIWLNPLSSLTFTGNITVDTAISSITNLDLSANIMVNDNLILNNSVNVSSGGVLTMGAHSTITISGGSLSLSSGTLNLSSPYSVSYTGSSSVYTGAELTGSGLGNVTINLSGGNSVMLGANLTTNDSLKFINGTLSLNGYNLTVNGTMSGNILLAGNANSNLTINSAGGLHSSLVFEAGNNDLNNFSVNVGSGNSVSVSSSLNVMGNLSISSGGMLNISSANLTVSGNMTGTDSLKVNSATNLAFETGNSITGNLYLTGGTVNMFSMNVGSSDNLTLGANLSADTINLVSGTLVLNGNNLSVGSDIVANGTGTISSTSASNVSVTGSASINGALMFSASGDSVNNFTVNVAGGGSLNVGSDLVVQGVLNFMNGKLDIGSNNLNIAASGSISGAGSSSYVVTGSGGYLTMSANVGQTTTFQIGTSSNYLPAAITLNTGSSTGTIGLNTSTGVYAQGTTGAMLSATQPMVDATWTFLNNIGAGINANMQLSWSASAEVNGFVHNDDYISHYTSGAWDDIGDSMTAMVSGSLYSVTRANVTSMSPFAVFDKNTVTGVGNVSETNDPIIIYPNPAYQNLYIENTGLTGVINVEIYNTLGQMVSNMQFEQNGAISIPVNSLPDGTYFLRLYSNNMQVVRKFSKL